MTNGKISRRRFLGSAGAAVAVPYAITSTALGGQSRPPASQRIVMGSIGIGGRSIGQQVLHNFLAEPEVQMVAVCDVQSDRRERGQAVVNGTYGNKDCAAYRDLRDLLARKDIDAVFIATGDRWHALASAMAARAGKDVYCEKPMSLTIAEGRAVADTMRRCARVYQGGTQRRSVPKFLYAADTARSGKLGRLQTVYAYTPGFVYNIGACQARPPQPEPPREVIDWDLWLGPPPWRPYNSAYVTGLGGWSHIPDLGGGGITDWGTHQADLAQYANDAEMSSPVEYEQLGAGEVAATYTNGVKLVFHAGIPAGGCLMARFEGAEGWISVDDNLGFEADPPSLLGPYRASERGTYEKATNHIQDFLRSIRTRQQPVCNAEVAQRATTACHAANICLRLGRPLTWDPAKEEFVGDELANRMRSRAMREPWRF
ncbi:MAG: Gfo/Idh/MocA family protein [Planctomycetota bacterium]